jgi:cytochrome c oxidase subunit 2
MIRVRQILSVCSALFLVPVGCFGQQSLLKPAGPQAGKIEWLYWTIFWIAFIVYVLVIMAFTRASTRNRISGDRPAPVLKNPAGERGAFIAVHSALLITIFTLFVVLVMSIVTGAKVGGISSKNPVTIQITGHQWWWEVTYPNSQADQTVITANEIHVPVGTPVVVLTSSADVIHSFWAPNINGKRDLLPGYQNAVWMQVDKPGIYRGQCAEFCGYQHAHMGFEIVAQSTEEFSKWLEQQRKPAEPPRDPDAAQGLQVFMSHACVMCHTIRGTDAGSRMGPDLTHIASRHMIAAETLPNTRGALAGWIVDPQSTKPGSQMAANPLPPDDLNALIAYLQSLE